MKRPIYLLLAAAGLAALGWWGYTAQRAAWGPAFEVAAAPVQSSAIRTPDDPVPTQTAETRSP